MPKNLALRKLVHVAVAALAIMAANTLGAGAAPARSGASAETTMCQPGAVLIQGACIAPATSFQKSFSARLKPGAIVLAQSGCGPGFPPVDLQSNPNHCGMCGNACETGFCTQGVCLTTTTVTVTQASASTINLGQSVTFTTRVYQNQGNDPNTGTVTFHDGSTTLGTGSVANGWATFTTTALSAGAHSVTATYGGSIGGAYRPSDAALPASVTVNDAADSTTTVSSSLNPSTVGQAVRFTATVAGSAGAPTGTVQFRNGATALGSAVAVNTLGVGQPVTGGENHTCALTSVGAVKCWGYNGHGQLGDSTTTQRTTPVAVSGLASGVVALAGGANHTCALTSAGAVKCWGNNAHGQLGDGSLTNRLTPVDVDGLGSGVIALAAGIIHTCALTGAGVVKCWGNNVHGQLGDLSTHRVTPVDVSGLGSGVAALAGGGFHTCALTNAGGVKCWGYNGEGALGDGGITSRNTPADVSGLGMGVAAITGGFDYTCALMTTGGVKCWGFNGNGQLGDGTTTRRLTPVDVSGLASGIAAIAGGGIHICALTGAGAVKCWGYNSVGQLGDGTMTQRTSPVDVSGLASGIAAIAGGGYHTCALTVAGAARCWGANWYGQVGDGTTTERTAPTNVSGFGAGAALVFGNATLTTSALAGGSHSITAAYSGDTNHDGSASSALTQTVNKLDQTVSFTTTAPANAKFGGSYNAEATASSGLTVTLGASGACSYSGGAVQFDAAGSCDVTADQAGNASYNAAPQETQTFTIDKADQTISFTTSAPANAAFGGSYNAAATATSGLTVTLGASGACSYSGGAVHFDVAGSCTVTADQGGNANYNAASQETQTFTVNKADQTVSFTSSAPASPKVGDTYTPTASATSGLTATVGANGVCAFSAGQVTFNTAGSCTVTANQGGNANYNAAAQATQSITVGKATPTVAAGAMPATIKPGQSVTVTADITAPSGVTPGGSVNFKRGNKPLGSANVAASKATLDVPDLTIGSHTITAEYTGDDNLATKSATVVVKVSAAVGPETRVNTTTTGMQDQPVIARLNSGYVIAWVSSGQDGAGDGVFMQRYAANGRTAGVESQVNTTTAGDQSEPAVAGLLNGGFVVVWQSTTGDGAGMGTGVYGQMFKANGTKQGKEFRVNKTTRNDQSVPAVAALEDGGFVVTWVSNAQDGAGLGIYAQIYTAAGQPEGAEFKVNKTTAGHQTAPAVAGLGNGFVVAWQSADDSGQGIFMQRYNTANKVAGVETRVNKTELNDQTLPSVTPLAAGGFVIAWQSKLQDGSGLGTYMQRFNSNGAKLGNEQRVNATTVNDQSAPAIASFTDEGFVVVWQSRGQDGSGLGVVAQVFDNAGRVVNSEFVVNTTTANDQSQPAVAAFADGNFTAAWTSDGQDGSGTGIYAQRFQVPLE